MIKRIKVNPFFLLNKILNSCKILFNIHYTFIRVKTYSVTNILNSQGRQRTVPFTSEEKLIRNFW